MRYGEITATPGGDTVRLERHFPLKISCHLISNSR